MLLAAQELEVAVGPVLAVKSDLAPLVVVVEKVVAQEPLVAAAQESTVLDLLALIRDLTILLLVWSALEVLDVGVLASAQVMLL